MIAGHRVAWASLCLALVWFAAPPRSSGDAVEPAAPHVEGELLVKFRGAVDPSARANARGRLGAERLRRFRTGVEHWKIGPGLSIPQAIAALRDDPHVAYAEPNYLVQMDAAPNDPRYAELWGLHNTGQSGGTPGADIDAERAWTVTTGSRDVLVAVIDTGIDFTHPDLAANMWVHPGEIAANGIDDDGNGFVDDVRGWDFVNDDNDSFDDAGHGTHCAGTIGAVANNGVGVAGVNWQVSLVGLKFLGADGVGTTADAVAAVEYATSIGADITSNSWGGGGYSQALLDAIQAAAAANVLFVAAAGNDGTNNDTTPHYPSSFDAPNVIAVAATDRNDALAWFSNYGRLTVDLSAPGVDILSTLPGAAYGYSNGTSMATPHVAGAAALVRALAPDAPVTALKAQLLDAVDPVPALSGITVAGGRLNVFLATAARETTPPGAPVDLTVGSPTSYSLTLTWTAPGDDGDTGTAFLYDIRYSPTPFGEAEFDSASPLSGIPAPQSAGSLETFEARGLSFETTYYFALRAVDEWGNTGAMSNLSSGTTLGPPDIGVSPASVDADLLTGATTTRTVTLSNAGPGHLVFDLAVRRPAGQAASDSPEQEPPSPLDETSGPAWAAGDPPSTEPVEPSTIASLAALTSGLRIVFLESGGDVTQMRDLLAAFPDVTAVDVLSDTATLDELLPYDAVIVVSQLPWNDPVAVGNVLADYADAGGGVILTLASFVPSWSVRGRFETEGYSPLRGIRGPIGASSLGSFDAHHPIMAGVGTAWGDVLAEADLAPGAEWVADWAFGEPFIATRGHNVAAINVYFGGPGWWTGDIPLVLHNAVAWTAGAASWLAVDPVSGIVPPGGSLDLTVTLDAAGLIGGDYTTDLRVTSNDPDEPELTVPVHLHVTGAPDVAIRVAPVLVESSLTYDIDGARTAHALPVLFAPAGSGSIELVADGDFGDSSESAMLSVEGSQLGSVGGAGSDCTVASRTFPLSASQLAGFAADGVVQVDVQNSPNVGVFCSVNRHTVRLRYERPADRLDFGSFFVGLTRTLSLFVDNPGTDTLVVTSITSDRPDFAPSTASLVVAPGESQELTVAFTPSAAGRTEGVLALQTNDPDEPALTLALVGEGLVPPDIAVSPASISEGLLTGESVTRTVTVFNQGGSDLRLDVGIGQTGAVPLELPAGLISATEPSTGATPTDAEGRASVPSAPVSLAGATVLLVQDLAPWNTTSNELVLAASGLAFDRVGSAGLAGADLTRYRMVLVASDQTTAFYDTIQTQVPRLSEFVTRGGVLEFHAAGWGYNGGDASRVTLPDGVAIRYYSSYYNYIVDPAHPLVAGVSSPIAPYASHAYFSELPAGASVVTTDDSGRPSLAVYRVGAGSVVAAGQTLEYGRANGYATGVLLNNMIPYSHGLFAPWLAIEPRQGMVPAGGSLDLTVTLDAAGLPGGDYGSDLRVASNDPDEPALTVPVHLHVTGVPDAEIRVAPVVIESSLPYGTNGAQTSHELPIPFAPAGPGTVELIADGEYGASYETATLFVEGLQLGSVGGTGTDCTAASGTFTLSASQLAGVAADGVVRVDVQNSLDVHAFCAVNRHTVRLRYERPGDGLDFGSFFVGLTRTLSLFVDNPGTDTLVVTSIASDRPDFVPSTASCVVPPGRSEELTVAFTPSAGGRSEGVLRIESNDPDEPVLTLALVGEGLIPPDIAVSPASISEGLLSGESVTRTVTVLNQGGSDLTLDVGIGQTGAVPLELPAGLISATEPSTGATPTDAEGRASVPSEPVSLTDATVLLVQDHAPWGATSNELVLAASGLAFDRVGSAGLAGADLTRYRMVLVAADQTTAFYDTIQTQVPRLSEFVTRGGVLEFHAAGWGYNGGDASRVTLPDGVAIRYYSSYYNYIVDPAHPLVAGVSSPIAPYASHAYFSELPAGASVVTTDDSGRPSLAVYRVGAGFVVAAGQTLEFGWVHGYPTGVLLSNMIPYSHGLFAPWLAIEPRQGVVPAGGSLDLTVTLDAAGLVDGDYDAILEVASNDPDEPELTVPVHLHVTGVPDAVIRIAPVLVESSLAYDANAAHTSHELPVQVPPPGPGSIELIADGDYGDSFETAHLTVEGYQLGSVGGVGSDCTPASRTFELSAAQLAGFVADGVVQAEVQNSSGVGPLCSLNRHTVRLRYDQPGDRLDFGSFFVGLTRTRSFFLENPGTAALTVTSITSDRSDFVPSAASFVVAPGQAQELTVAFTPSAGGQAVGVLRIDSNDPEEPVLALALVGEGLVPPDIAVSPASISEGLVTGASVGRTVTVFNQGGSDLAFHAGIGATGGVPLELPAGLISATEHLTGATSTDAEGRASVPSLPVSLADATVLLVQDHAPWGATSNEQVLAASGLAFDRVGSAGLAGADLTRYAVVLVASDQTTAFYQSIQAQISRLTEFVTRGGVLEFHAAGWGYNGGDASQVTLPDGVAIRYYSSYYNYIVDPAHPIVAGVSNPIAPYASHAYFLELPVGADVVATDDSGRPSLAVYRVGAGFVVAAGQTLEYGRANGYATGVLLNNMIPYSHGLFASWASVEPRSGVVPAGGSLDLSVTLDAAGLPGGDYGSDLRVASNDPDEPELTVPVHLHVTGAPDAEIRVAVVIESSLPYGTNGARTSHELPLPAAPVGPGFLELTVEGEFGSTYEIATVFVEGYQIGNVGGVGSDCVPANRTFPLSAAQLAGFAADGVVRVDVQNSLDVHAFCTVNRHTVRLRYDQPSDRLDFGSLFVGETRTLSLFVDNPGTDTLVVTSVTSDRPDFVPSTSSFALTPGQSQELMVAFVPSAGGRIESLLRIASNDPDEPVLTLALVGEALVPADIAVSPASIAEELFTGGSATRTVTVLNQGGIDLTFDVETGGTGGPPLELPAGLLEAPEHAVGATSTDPESPPSVPSEPVSLAGATVLLVQDVSPWDTTSNEQVLAANGIAFDRVGSAGLAGADLARYRMVLVASDQTTAFYQSVQTQISRLTEFVTRGGVLEFHAAGWGYNGGDASRVTLPRGMEIRYFLSFFNNVVDPAHPLVAGLPMAFGQYWSTSHAYFIDLPAGAEVVATDAQGRPSLVTYRVGAGFVVAATQSLEYGRTAGRATGVLLNHMIPYSHGLFAPWLAIEPHQGVIPAGGALDLTLTVDAAGLPGGDHDSDLRITSNDPDEPEVLVPVHLHVTGAPDVAIRFAPGVVESTLSYDIDGARTSHALPIALPPTGPGTIELIADGDYGEPHESATLIVEGTYLGSAGRVGVDCTLAPETFPLSTEELAGFAADGVIYVDVQNSAGVDPFCSVNRHTVRVRFGPTGDRLDFGSFFIGLARTQSFFVDNPGAETLLVTSIVADRPDFVPSITSLAIPPGETQELTVAFTPTAPGVADALLTLQSNDPDEPSVTVSLRGEGLLPPEIAVAPSLSETALLGGATTRPLTVQNRGAAVLTFDVEVLGSSAIFSVAPLAGTIDPGSSMDLEVGFDARALSAGHYDATILIRSNDPAAPQVSVPTTLHARTNDPPVARAGTDTRAGCTSSAGALVTLDGTGSSDPDASDDIVLHEWFEEYGLPGERGVAVGASVALTLPLGVHTLTLQVTDRFGATSTDEVGVTIDDEVPPVLVCPAQAVLECPADTSPAHTGAPVAQDVCGAVSVSLHDVTVGGCGQTSTTDREWIATDASGNVASCTQSILVADTTPPSVLPPAPLAVECSILGGVPGNDPGVSAWLASAVVADSCGTAGPIPEVRSLFPLGSTLVPFRGVDACGNLAIATETLEIADTVAPSIAVALAPDLLWPPNHRMIEITATVVATDVCGPPSVVLTSVTSNEPDDAEGDGSTVGDIQNATLGTPDDHLSLRAERAGGGWGRIYTAVYTAMDASGNIESRAGFALVPHDQGGVTDPIHVSVQQAGNGTLLSWTGAPDAQSYDVIRGSLSDIRDGGPVFDLGPVVCVEENSSDTSTAGFEDVAEPPADAVFFYLVEYNNGASSSFGTVSAGKPRAPGGGGCAAAPGG